MDWTDIGTERKLVAGTFVFLFVTVMSMGIFMEQTVAVSRYGGEVSSFDADLPVEYRQLTEESSGSGLKAIVKGSIYEEGDNMTVYGACFDGDGYLLPDASTEFTAWYPNGTIMLGPNASMDAITDDFEGYHPNGTGRWKIHVTMGDTIGTYLTEMRCVLDDEWAVSFGEWQNPAWVKRIGMIDTNLINVSQDLSAFRSDTEINFSNVLQAIDAVNTGNVEADLYALTDSLRAVDLNMWTLDSSNPFYVLSSDVHNFEAVDMLSPDTIAAASGDGYFVRWDGETWSEIGFSGYAFRGVSVLPANVPYAWAVGTDGASPVYTINGNAPQIFSPPSGAPTTLNDVKLFQSPNNPSGPFYGYLIGDDGSIYMSSDSGGTWSTVTTIDAGTVGRFSQVVDNYGVDAQSNGYMLLIGQGSDVLLDDGVSQSAYIVNGTIKDVSLLFHDVGYVVTKDVADTKIYRFDGGDLTLEYTIEDASIEPTGIVALNRDDVWLVTADPSTFYHFDGHRWEYSTVAYSEYVSVIINFNGNQSGKGVRDVAMSDSRHGVAVGADGLILRYTSQTERGIESVLSAIDNISLSVNLTSIEDRLAAMNLTLEDVNLTTQDTLAIVQLMDLELGELYSISQGNFTLIGAKLDALSSNQSLLDDRLVQVLSNQTQTHTLIAALNQTIDLMYADMLQGISDIRSDIFVLNATTISAIDGLESTLSDVNTTINYKLDNVLNNVTYTQLYLETTIEPTLNSILVRLGIIEQTVNETRSIANETRSIVNESATDIDELVNKSRRIRAWITQ